MGSAAPPPTSPRAHSADRTATTVCITLAVCVVILVAAFTIRSYRTKTAPPETVQRRRSLEGKRLPASILQTFRLVTYDAEANMTDIDVEKGPVNMKRPGSMIVEEKHLEVPQTAHCREDGTATTTLARADGAELPPRIGYLDCSICMHTFNMNDKIRVLPCKHDFHQACIDPWLVGFSGTCPVW